MGQYAIIRPDIYLLFYGLIQVLYPVWQYDRYRRLSLGQPDSPETQQTVHKSFLHSPQNGEAWREDRWYGNALP